jgi:hypothetical protein
VIDGTDSEGYNKGVDREKQGHSAEDMGSFEALSLFPTDSVGYVMLDNQTPDQTTKKAEVTL